MSAALSTLSPLTAWQPLPRSEWDEPAARHLLQRIGFAVTRDAVARALAGSPVDVVRRAFGRMPEFREPPLVRAFRRGTEENDAAAKRLAPAARRVARRDRREQSREAEIELVIEWLKLARAPEHSAAEKWLLFLSDVWVVSTEKVNDAALIFQHQDILRRHALRSAPSLARAVLHSPAMLLYLDLQQSRPDAPNENFAREFFELFTLGEGHYSERDIKEAARAFTGYRQREGQVRFVPRQHDDGRKTVFGHTGRLDGGDVIELVFRQPAAGTFLPREMVRFYLGDTPLPEPLIDALGAQWSQTGHEMRPLLETFFASRAFFAAEYRGNFIKSPVQFYLGLLEDLSLELTPLPRRTITPLSQMGQLPFDAPNVRGWVGGRAWINSATLTARRQLIRALTNPLDPAILNADERATLKSAEAAGARDFTLPEERLQQWSRLSPPDVVDRLLATCLPGRRTDDLVAPLTLFFADESYGSVPAVRAALAALLESPAYQLC